MILSFVLKNLFVFGLSLVLPNINKFERLSIAFSWTAVFFVFYWLTCLTISLVDCFWYGIPFRLCEGSKFPADVKNKIILQVLINQFVVTPLYMISTTYTLPIYRSFWMPVLPLYISIPIFILLADAAFFVLHWIAHWPFFFKHIHSMHHSIRHRFAAAAIYCNPVEMWMVNLLSGAIPAFLVGFDDSMIFVVVAASAIDTTIAHSRWSALHFVHHKMKHLAFGTSLNMVDKLTGFDYSGEKVEEMKKHWDGPIV